MSKTLSRLHFDWYLLVPVLYLTTLGLILQNSINLKRTGVAIELSLVSQGIAIGTGLLLMLFINQTSVVSIRRVAWPAWIASIVLLASVLIWEQVVQGSARWVSIGGVRFQPSELAKVALILVMAELVSQKVTVLRTWKFLGIAAVTLIPLAILTALQPDLGTTMVYVAIWVTIILTSRVPSSKLAVLAIVGIVGLAVLIPNLHDYQRQRLFSYLNPRQDVAGGNYNTIQAGIAIGNGGLKGTGLESGPQSQLNFLPSQHTDFIFAVAAEKLGFIGAGSIIVALGVILGRTSYLLWRAKSAYATAILAGALGFLLIHSLVNIGMNLGLLPVAGIPLPFISYGGTYLIATFAVLGLILRVSRSR